MSDSTQKNFLEKLFKLKENNTNIKTEIIAGITTFMTMSYILAVNPAILSEAGMDKGGVFTATILASVIATVMMGIYANHPFALSAGMGLNAYFAYTVVLQKGNSWQFALTAVFIEGIIFLIMSLFKMREKIFNSIPMTLKKAVSVGIGLFIAFIGLSGSQIVVQGKGVPLTLGNLLTPGVVVTVFGLIVTGVLLHKKIKGAILYGIILSTILAIIVGIASLPEKVISIPPSVMPVAMKMEWSKVFTIDMAVTVFAFLFVDVFDTIGTLIGVSTKANMLDKDGNFPRVGKALLSDAVGTTVGAMLGTSTITTYVESSAGVSEGGRTGLTAIITSALFMLSLFLAPLFTMIPAQATAPALILVGLFMMSPIREIDFSDYTEAIPAFLTIVMMPFAYSIAQGIVFGMVSYVILKVLSGKFKDVSILMYILGILFIAEIILSNI